MAVRLALIWILAWLLAFALVRAGTVVPAAVTWLVEPDVATCTYVASDGRTYLLDDAAAADDRC